MPAVVVVGSQWGDEGKGKVANYLALEADVVVRYQGGPNAGHTVVVDETEIQLHLLPTGIIYPDKLSVIGNGVVVDPQVLVQEMEGLKKSGYDMRGLRVSSRAHLIMPYHRLLDALQEEGLGSHKIGTTLKGVGPAYMDKSARVGIRVGELLEPDSFREKLLPVLKDKNRVLQHFYGREPLDAAPIIDSYLEAGEYLREYVTDTSFLVNDALKGGKRVLFEGAQGTLLDLDHGTYPYVTSSHPIAGGACIGAGIGPTRIDKVIGVMKAFTSRVGDGPVPTELKDETSALIRERGHEFGVTTGRPRRIGWLDLVVVRYAAVLSGFTSLAVTRMDILSNMGTVKVACAYKYRGKELRDFPDSLRVLEECEPVYREFQGWPEIDPSARSLDDLHPNARRYLEFAAEETGVPISLISLGRKRKETLVLEKVF
jgi:adenylosuccinate synthase